MCTLEENFTRVLVTPCFHPPQRRNIAMHVVVRSSLGRCRAILPISHSVLLTWNVQPDGVMMMEDAGRSAGRSCFQSPQVVVLTLTITPVSCIVDGRHASPSSGLLRIRSPQLQMTAVLPSILCKMVRSVLPVPPRTNARNSPPWMTM